MIVLTVSITGFLLYLIYERLSVDRWRRTIPLVITVTGTRGKSSVTRLLAAVLRQDGRKVLAKTTGAEPKLIWPDGAETAVRLRGPASIIEQKTLLKNASQSNADCLVAEVMSIHPDNHAVESQQILRPDIVAITNAWPDHVDAMGYIEGTTPAESRYTATELELLAIVWALRYFRPYVGRGERPDFVVVTDHKALENISPATAPSRSTDRLVRWILELQGINFRLMHRKGSENDLADALSRAPVGAAETLLEIELPLHAEPPAIAASLAVAEPGSR